ncbi:MAG: hypothetical protein IBX69_16925 [Anaerolineales bacterium]|nr:hypothetical protein [Anaerolineales bacterium]
MQPLSSYPASLQILIQAGQSDPLNAGEVGLFVFDFDSLYEMVRLTVDPKYASFNFSRFALYRNAKRLSNEDKLYVQLLRLASPMEMASTIAVYSGAAASIVATLWILVQALERIYNLKLNREKLQLEIQKLKRDLSTESKVLIEPDPFDVTHSIEERGASEYLDTIEKRLSRSSIQIEEVKIRVDFENR